MTSRAWQILFVIVISIAYSTLASAQGTPNVYDAIGEQKLNGLPQGNFTSWSDEYKKTALQKTVQSCLFLCGMLFSAPTKSVETTKEENSTCLLSCVAKHLPADDPRATDFQNQAQQHYAAAKQLGSVLPAPTFTHSTPNAPSPNTK